MTRIINHIPKIGAKPGIIGATNNPDQAQVIDSLKEALALALEGAVTSVGLIICMKNGYATHLAGRQASDLYMGCGSLQRKILSAVEESGEEVAARAERMADHG